MAKRSRKSKSKKTSRKAGKRRAARRHVTPRRKTTRRKAARRPVRRRRRARANPVATTAVRAVRSNPTISPATLNKLLENARRPKRRRPRRRLEENVRRRRPRRRAASNPRRRRAQANPVVHLVNTNPWYGQPRRHAKAAKKGWNRRRRHGGTRGKRKAARRRRHGCKPCTAHRCGQILARRRPHQPGGGPYGGRGYSRLAENPMFEDMGLASGLNLNPLDMGQSPFTARGITHVVLAGAVAGASFWIADLLDKGVATRTPKGGKFPYYAAEAAAAQNARPDAWRFAAQIGAAAASLAAAWGLRKHSAIAPVVFGAGAVGFLGNTFKMLGNWYLGPALAKVKPEDSGKPSLGNRFFAIEQDYLQKDIAKLFADENWKNSPSLLAAQTANAEGKPTITPIGSTAFSGTVMALGGASDSGKARTNGEAAGTVGSGQTPRVFLSTGRLGNCPICGGHDGCYSDCGTLCSQCDDYCPSTECHYDVQSGDDLAALAQAGGVSIESVNELNGGMSPDQYWIVGNTVRLPYGICQLVSRQPSQPAPMQPMEPLQPVLTDTSTRIAPEEPYVAPVVAGPRVNLFDFGLGEPEEGEEDMEAED